MPASSQALASGRYWSGSVKARAALNFMGPPGGSTGHPTEGAPWDRRRHPDAVEVERSVDPGCRWCDPMVSWALIVE